MTFFRYLYGSWWKDLTWFLSKIQNKTWQAPFCRVQSLNTECPKFLPGLVGTKWWGALATLSIWSQALIPTQSPSSLKGGLRWKSTRAQELLLICIWEPSLEVMQSCRRQWIHAMVRLDHSVLVALLETEDFALGVAVSTSVTTLRNFWVHL